MTVKELCERWREIAKKRRDSSEAEAKAFEFCAEDLEVAADRFSHFLCPTPELNGKYPVVIYFENEEDSRELIEAVKLAKPNMISKTL